MYGFVGFVVVLKSMVWIRSMVGGMERRFTTHNAINDVYDYTITRISIHANHTRSLYKYRQPQKSELERPKRYNVYIPSRLAPHLAYQARAISLFIFLLRLLWVLCGPAASVNQSRVNFIFRFFVSFFVFCFPIIFIMISRAFAPYMAI